MTPAVSRDPDVRRAARGVRAPRQRRDPGVVRPPPRVPGLAVAAIVLVAAVWFWPGLWLSLEWVDQGQIVYGVWRVARGDLPYRDFVHMYGPSLFFLNGALMRWFGEDLAVIRIGLLAVKALLAGLLFVVCRTVARPAIALLVSAWFVVQWGSPLWIFATPYAGHYALACSLAGIAILLGRGSDGWGAALAAGLAVGTGATFKHTSGLFAALAVLVVLTSRPIPAGERDAYASLGRASRSAVAIATVLIAVAYLARVLDTWTAALLVTPPLLALTVEWLPDLPEERALVRGGPRLVPALAFGIGFAMPVAAWVVIYASQGALPSLAHDLFSGLPARVSWHVPLETPHLITIGFVAVLLGGALGLAAGRPALVALAGLATVALFLAATFVPGAGILEVQMTRFLPIALVWAAAPLALRSPSDEASRLVWWFGAMLCLSLHPSSDLPHALMILPGVLPVLALLIEEAWRRAATPLARAGVVTLVGAPLL